jgi:hypothetical protein
MATTAKIAISIDKKILDKIDIKEEKIFKFDKSRLAVGSAKLNKAEEQ